jgi:hypothetical protein
LRRDDARPKRPSSARASACALVEDGPVTMILDS